MTNAMSPKEKEFTILMVIVAAAIILWYWWEKRQAANAVTAPAPSSDFSNWPMDQTPDYTPPTVNLDIGNQTPNLLSQQYMPLFGFVGMAQGTYFH
jgi:hypothetical protein